MNRSRIIRRRMRSAGAAGPGRGWRTDQVQHLEHHRGEPVQVAGSRGPLELAGQTLDGDPRHVVGRVHARHVRHEDEARPIPLQEGQVAMLVAVQRARFVEGRELPGVHECADHHAAVLCTGAADERELAIVQHSHRRRSRPSHRPGVARDAAQPGTVRSCDQLRRTAARSGARAGAFDISTIRSQSRSATCLGSIGQSLSSPSAPNTITLFSSEPTRRRPLTVLPTIRSSPLSAAC